MLQKIPHYWKTVVATVGGVIVVGNQVVDAINDNGADGSLSTSDWITIGVVAATAVGVYAKANKPNEDN